MASDGFPDDPYFWTVDQLAYELCRNPQPLWASQAKKASLPAPEVFENAIRENVLDGESFMAMDMPEIASELRISAFGIKRNVHKIIRFMRGISAEYQRQNIGDKMMPYVNGVHSPQITASDFSGQPQSIGYGNRTPFRDYTTPHLRGVYNSPQAQWSGFEPLVETAARNLRPPLLDGNPTPQPQPNLRDPAGDSGFHEPDSEGDHPVHVKLGLSNIAKEHAIQKSIQEKRRTPEVSPLQKNDSTPQTLFSEQPSLPPSTAVTKAPKRVAPTFISHITQDHTAAFSTNRSGHVLPHDVATSDIDPDYEFVIAESSEPFEARKTAASTTRAFLLHNNSITRSEHGILSTRQRHLRKDVMDDTRADPAVEQDHNPFLVSEQQPLQRGEPRTISDHPDHPDLPAELAWLLKRHLPSDDEKVYQLFGESGDEGEYDEETWAEIDAEAEEFRGRVVSAGALSVDTVDKAIDEAIEEMRVEWQSNKLPKTQNKGYRMWNEASRTHTQHQMIAESNFWLNRFEDRIRKLRVAINDGEWHKVTDVKAQCTSLEESVFQREEHRYYISILEKDEAPPRPDWKILSRVRNQDRPEAPEGEEILESDPEPLSDDGFIEDDTSDTNSIPYEGPSSTSRRTIPETVGPVIPAPELSDTETDSMSIAEVRSSQDVEEPANSTEDSGTDSDDQIIGSARRRPLLRVSAEETTTPSRKPRSSQYSVEPFDEDDESDLNSDLDLPPPLPRSEHRKHGTPQQPIVLTSSPSAPDSQDRDASMGSIRTPSLNPDPAYLKREHEIKFSDNRSIRIKSSPSSPRFRLSSSPNDDSPNFDDIEAIRDLEWEAIEEDVDNRRALAKAVYLLDLEFAVKLQAYSKKVVIYAGKNKACELVKKAVLAYGQKDAIEQVGNREQALARSLGRLFITYNNAMDCMAEPVLSGGTLDCTYEAVDNGCQKFFVVLELALDAYCSSGTIEKGLRRKRKSDDISTLGELANDSDILVTSEDQDQEIEYQENIETNAVRSAKKRKKKVLQSQEAETQQADDRARVAEQEFRRSLMQQKLKDMQDSVKGDLDTSSFHPVSLDPSNPVYLDPHIGKMVKPHQENGIQFMWRELTAGKGCMLAHTMGLGKTMQVIALLITIAQASQSDNPNIRNQVPKNLQTSRTLILGPPSLVDNWYDEILMWTPKGSLVLGDVRKIAAATGKFERTMYIKSWARDGGVLLMSYSLFKQIVEKKSKFIPEEERESYAIMLTREPNIVVADEAHNMKNPKSALAKAAKQLMTKARIALTGSPLSNHLEEYHQMVDWISPGYLGTLVQFKAKYSEPIKEGLYSNSTASERRLSARKLLVLNRDLAPKICRADLSAITNDIPKKVEFFITIPLTDVQRDAYSKYAKHMLRDHGDTSGQAKIWSWLSVLSLLLNHPSAFVKKLQEKDELEAEDDVGTGEDAVEREASVDTEDLSLPANVKMSSVGLSPEATKDILSAFDTISPNHIDWVRHSYRSLLTVRIVKASMRIQEKVLIFSHSIPTLNYLERIMEKLHCTYARIDGSTNMATRQDTAKLFNEREDIQVMLISTTAGGLGLNLQGANRVIIYDFNFNPTWEEQAIGRAYRLGQTKHVFVYRFRAGGTFEDIVYNMSIFKTQLFARVVDKRNPTRFASKSISDYLFPPREVEQTELDGSVRRDPEVLNKIMEQQDYIRKVELTETFQVEEDDELTPEELRQADQENEDEVLARDNPGKLAQLQHERLQKAAAEKAQVRGARRVSAPQRRTPSPVRSMPYDPRDRTILASIASIASSGLVPQPPLTTHDDMHLDRPSAPSRGRAKSISGDIPQIDGQTDRPIGCEQQ